MTTYRVKHNRTNPYVRLNKKFLESNQFSAKAKGILAYLLSRPDNWKICLKQLMKVFSDGEVSIRSGLKELKDAGYLVKAVIRDSKGRIAGWRTDVYETPQPQNQQIDKNGNRQHTQYTAVELTEENLDVAQLDVDYPEMVAPVVVHPDVGFPDLDNRVLINNEDLLTNDLTNPPLSPPRTIHNTPAEKQATQVAMRSALASKRNCGERKEENWHTEVKGGVSQTSVSEDLLVSDCWEEQNLSDEEKSSAPPPFQSTATEERYAP